MPDFSEGLIEPNMKFLKCNRVVLAKAVINMPQSMVPLRVLNLSDQSWGVQMEVGDVLFKHIHQSRMAGLFGVRKTLFNVKLRFWWADVLADVTRWCHECRQSQFRNVRTGRGRAALRQVGSPPERIAMDILSLPVESQAGNICILVVSDYFTKWAEAVALPDHKAIMWQTLLSLECFSDTGRLV